MLTSRFAEFDENFFDNNCNPQLCRCPSCGENNYPLAINSGICAWCGWDAVTEKIHPDQEVVISAHTKLTIDEQTCLVFAARYAHARQTGGAYSVVHTALRNWDRLDTHTQDQLIEEAENEARTNLSEWDKLIAKKGL